MQGNEGYVYTKPQKKLLESLHGTREFIKLPFGANLEEYGVTIPDKDIEQDFISDIGSLTKIYLRVEHGENHP